MGKDFLRLFEPDASFRICSYPPTLALIEAKSHEYNSYTTLGVSSPRLAPTTAPHSSQSLA